MLKNILAILSLSLVSNGARAASKQLCSNYGTVVNAAEMNSSQSFEYNGKTSTGWGLATIHMDLTDANTSITTLAMSCVGKYAGYSDEYILQSCSTSSGVCTSDDASWEKSSPGTKKWVWRADIEGIQSLRCTVTVGAGTGASVDLLTARVRLCTKG